MKKYRPNLRSLKARDERVREAHFQYSQNRISRREFLRFSSALGGGALAMSLLPSVDRLQIQRAKMTAQEATPQRGGVVTIGAYHDLVEPFDDPATLNSVYSSNII